MKGMTWRGKESTRKTFASEKCLHTFFRFAVCSLELYLRLVSKKEFQKNFENEAPKLSCNITIQIGNKGQNFVAVKVLNLNKAL